MIKDGGQGKWSFGLLWVIVNTFGWAVLIVVSLAAGWIVWKFYEDFGIGLIIRFRAFRLHENGSIELIRIAIAGVIAYLCGGAIMGVLQQYVLRRRFELEGRGWIWATIIGLIVYMTVQTSTSILAATMGFPSSQILTGISIFVAPFALGIAQWVILRRYFTRSGLWIVATVIAFWLSHFARSTFGTGQIWISVAVVFYLVEGFLYGIATLIAITVISRPPTVAVANA